MKGWNDAYLPRTKTQENPTTNHIFSCDDSFAYFYKSQGRHKKSEQLTAEQIKLYSCRQSLVCLKSSELCRGYTMDGGDGTTLAYYNAQLPITSKLYELTSGILTVGSHGNPT